MMLNFYWLKKQIKTVISDADFEFTTEQIKKVLFAPLEATTILFWIKLIIPSDWKDREENGKNSISPIEVCTTSSPETSNLLSEHQLKCGTQNFRLLKIHSAFMIYIKLCRITSKWTIWASVVEHVEYLQFRNFDPKTYNSK